MIGITDDQGAMCVKTLIGRGGIGFLIETTDDRCINDSYNQLIILF